jgi:hypothetical protein
MRSIAPGFQPNGLNLSEGEYHLSHEGTACTNRFAENGESGTTSFDGARVVPVRSLAYTSFDDLHE